MIELDVPATFDTNVAIYAITDDAKGPTAAAIVASCPFVSVQVLNEYANAASRKLKRDWRTIAADLAKLRSAGPVILPIGEEAHHEARRLAFRYGVSFYDALMLAVALMGGARTIYSKDMQHGLFIDDRLRILDPFR